MVSIFFYGLFMDESLLAAKGIHPSTSVRGFVEGFRLHIGERATLLPAENCRSYGVVMEISEAEAAQLYSDPGVRDYVAEPVVVLLPDGTQVSAACYNLPAATSDVANKEYAAALLALVTRLGMPESYLESIRSVAES